MDKILEKMNFTTDQMAQFITLHTLGNFDGLRDFIKENVKEISDEELSLLYEALNDSNEQKEININDNEDNNNSLEENEMKKEETKDVTLHENYTLGKNDFLNGELNIDLMLESEEYRAGATKAKQEKLEEESKPITVAQFKEIKESINLILEALKELDEAKKKKDDEDDEEEMPKKKKELDKEKDDEEEKEEGKDKKKKMKEEVETVEEAVTEKNLDKKALDLIKKIGKIVNIDSAFGKFAQVDVKIDVIEKDLLAQIVKNKAFGAIWAAGKDKLGMEVLVGNMKEEVETVEETTEIKFKEDIDNKLSEENVDVKELINYVNENVKEEVSDEEYDNIIEYIVKQLNKDLEEGQEPITIEKEELVTEEESTEEVVEEESTEELKEENKEFVKECGELIESSITELSEADKIRASKLIEAVEFDTKEELEEAIKNIIKTFNQEDEEQKRLDEEAKKEEELRKLMENFVG